MTTTLASDRRLDIADRLALVLSSTVALAIKSQGFHWNVTGPSFLSLHELFGQQYAELHAASDEIAERMRALGATAPAGLAPYAARSVVADALDAMLDSRAMLAQLQKDNETLSWHCAELRRIADAADDTATGDLMNGRIAAHDKAAWMLRAQLAG